MGIEGEITMKRLFKRKERSITSNESYRLFLNGQFYGSGKLDFMHELIKDYLITNEMYGKSECVFKIEQVNRHIKW